MPFITALGSLFIGGCTNMGAFIFFTLQVFRTLFCSRLRIQETIKQIKIVGVDSCPIIMLTGAFSGLALALQSYIGFQRIGTVELIGMVVTLGMVREMGPVLTGTMVAGRCGSAITAEIGSMNVTEQIDALKTLNIDPFAYLIIPRIIASTVAMPLLSLITAFCGILAAYYFCAYIILINPETYWLVIRERVELADIIGGLIKAVSFGFLIGLISTYQGYTTRGGSRGVGAATTRSVVISAIALLIANYFLSSLLFQTGVA